MIQACIPLYTPPPATYADFPPPPFLWNYLLFFFIIFPLVYFLKWSLWKLILKFPPPTPWEGFSGGTSGKESACQCRRHKRCRFNLWVGKIPWSRKWQRTPIFLPGKFYRPRSLAAKITKSQTLLSMHTRNAAAPQKETMWGLCEESTPGLRMEQTPASQSQH